MNWVNLGAIPDARSSHSITPIGHDDLLCVLFGEHEPRLPIQPPNDVLIYNLKSNSWIKPSDSGDKPCPRFAHSASPIGSNSILVFGGRTAVAEDTAINDCYMYDVESSKWMKLNIETPPARNYHSATSDGHVCYVFGGCGLNGRLADLWQYDKREGKWSELPNNPEITGRGGPGFAYADNTLYVIGGFSGKEMGDVFKYDITAGTWHSVPTADASNYTSNAAPRFSARSVLAVSPHACSSTCGHHNHIIAFGGEIDPSDLGHAGAGMFSNDLLCLDTTTLTWHGLDIDKASEVPCARGWSAAAALKDGSMVVGGGLDVNNNRLGDLWKLEMH